MLRYLNVTLTVLAIVAAIVMVATSGEPVMTVLRGTRLEPVLQRFSWTNTIAFNLSIGYLVSVFFWLLVVYVPERARRSVLREHFAASYARFREAAIQVLLWASIGTHDSTLPAKLLDPQKFREFFEADKSRNWYAALNGLQGEPERLREVVLELKVLADEAAYILSSGIIKDPKVHRLFAVLKENIYRLNHSDVYTYDQVKYVGRFLWELLANFSFGEGYVDHDVIQVNIERL